MIRWMDKYRDGMTVYAYYDKTFDSTTANVINLVIWLVSLILPSNSASITYTSNRITNTNYTN